ncbi:MAG: SdrD B-like domain-containing protein [Bacteroidia bacterium]
MFTFLIVSSTQTLFAQCDNVTDAGVIAYPETECGISYDPALIQSISDPIGGTGALEITWLETTDPTTVAGNTSNYTVISGATGLTYNPPTITQTTWYQRRAKRAGCTSWLTTAWLIKELKSKPNATISQKPPSPCVGIPQTWEAADAGPGATYTWDFGANATPQFAYTRIASVTYSVAGLVTPLLTVELNGCDAITTDYVFVVDSPTASISPSGNVNFCSGASPVMLSANTGAGLSYQWFFNNNPIVFATNSTYSATQAGDYYVQVFNANGCSANSSVTTLACPCDNFISGGTIAANEWVCGSTFDPSLITSVVDPSGGSGTANYMWISTTDSAIVAGGIGGVTIIPNTNSLTYDPPTITQTTWFRRCAFRAGCSVVVESNWVKKELKPNPMVTATGGAFCVGDAISLSSSVTGGSTPYVYSWAGPNAFTSNISNPSITNNAAAADNGTYSLFVSDNNGCAGSANASVNVRSVSTGTFPNNYLNNCGAFNPAPLVEATSPTVSNGIGGEILEYQWEYRIGANPAQAIGGTAGTWAATNASYDAPTGLPASVSSGGLLTATVELRRNVRIQTAGGGCAEVQGNWITLEILEQPIASANNVPACSNQTAQLTATASVNAPATITAYSWSGPNGFTALGQTITINNVSAADAGNYTVTVISEQTTLQNTTATCSATATLSLTVNLSPSATATADGNANNSYCAGQAINLQATGGGTYSWSGPNNFTSTSANPTINASTTAATGTYNVTVTAANGCTATASVQVNVTNCPGSSIGDFVWFDANTNGIQDANEIGFSGITVTLYQVNGSINTPIATTITNGYGFYNFTNLLPGTYVVGFALPVDFTFSAKDQTTDGLDSDVNPFTGLTDAITLAAGQNINTIDAGLFPSQPVKATLGDFVFLDANLNGTQDNGETGVASVTVTLYNGLGNPLASTVTDGNGYYAFTNLSAGTYSVGFSLPTGYVFTTQDAGANSIFSEPKDSDANPNDGRTANVVLAANQNYLDLDAGLVPAQANTGSIGDFVWFDLNNNGLQETGEIGITNVTVTLYDNTNTAIATTTTNTFGQYIFNNVNAGTYTLSFSIPSGFVAVPQNAGADNIDSDINALGFTSPFAVNAGQIVDYQDAGFVTTTTPNLGAIGNFVWFDLNMNGTQDVGEPGAAGVTVTLYDNNAAPIQSTTTNVQGQYFFVNLPFATYFVGFSNLPSGYVFTNQTINTSNGSDANTSTGITPATVLSAGTPQDLNLDAGIKPQPSNNGLGSIGDFVWNDLNQDNTQDAGEPGVGNVTVELLNATTNAVLSTTTTTSTGYYLFTNLPAGDYAVQFSDLPTAFVFSLANVGNDTEDSDADPLTGRTGTISLAAGQDNLTIDAGINLNAGGTNTAIIGDFVWNDLNNNGRQDTGEPGVRGVTVTLYNSVGTAISSTVTDDTGFYLFFGVLGGTYSVGFSNYPTGFSLVPKNAPGSTNTNDSDPSPATGRTDAFSVVANQAKNDIDAGLTSSQATIGDFVWNDTNNNGIQDGGETGVSGITVTLYDNNNSAVAFTVTNGAGNYFFVNVNPGTYSVGFANLPTGSIFTTQDVNTGAGTDANDSDVNPATGTTAAFTVNAGTINYTIDAGIVPSPTSSLFGEVWFDINKDGLQGLGEPKVPGVTVSLLDNNNNVVSTTVSGGNGDYVFNNIAPGIYSVRFTTLPPNTGFTTPNVGGNDAIDSDVNPATGVSASTYAVAANQNVEAADAGITPLTSSITGLVWNDLLNEGVKAANEPTVAGITVTLYNALGQPVATTTTDAYGVYVFNNVLPGNYYVGFSLPVGYQFTTPNVGNDLDDSDVNPASGITNLYIVTAGANLTDIDAGIYFLPAQTAKLGDYVWYDLNNNGSQDPTEQGVSDVTVTLYSVVAGNDTPVGTTITNGNGYYLFLNLPVGAYRVGFSLPVNYTFTTANSGTDDKDSDVGNDGKTQTVFLNAGDSDLTLDAGIILCPPTTGSIGDFAWNDLNQNGIQDAGEPGLPQVVVNLLDTNGNTIATTTTDEFGYYVFTNVPAGNYALQFIAPTGYTLGTQNAGGDDDKDSDPDATTGITAYFTLPAGALITNQDAAFYEVNPAGTLRLGNFVWYDLDEDGIQDANEEGVAGVIVTLLDAFENPLQATATNSAGLYVFANLAPGDYKVAFGNLPNGYQFTIKVGNAALGSDVDPNLGITDVFTLSADRDDIDAGIVPSSGQPGASSIGNFVWNDLNNNGIQEANEPGIAGITVTLYAEDGTSVLDITSTDGLGYYIFNGLSAGNYVVGLSDIPLGYSNSPVNQGGDDTKDSDIQPITNKTLPFSLADNQANTDIDAGLYNPFATGAIGDFVWNDVNQNGVQENNEAGVSGVTVTLIDFSTGLPLGTTVSDDNGFYLFVGVPAGNYVLQFNNIPAGFDFSTPNQGGDDTQDSDVDNNGFTAPFTLTAGQVNTTLDAGLQSVRAAIGNYVWFDANRNGVQDSGENGIAGVTVNLLSGNTVVTSTITDGLGFYYFSNVFTGTYTLQFTNISPLLVFTQKDATNDNEDSDANADGKTDPFTVAAGTINYSYDAGLLFPQITSIQGYVWFDTDENGSQVPNANEDPVAGVTVTLYDNNGDPIAITVTGSDGLYQFDNILPGTYSVGFTNLPNGTSFTTQNATNDNDDSDADVTSGLTASFVVTGATPVTDIDAGILLPKGSIGNFVWLDTDENGQVTGNEVGINGVSVQLWSAGVNMLIGDGDDALITTTTTANNGNGDAGYYLFSGLNSGNYYVKFPLNVSASQSLTISNNAANTDNNSDANLFTGNSGLVIINVLGSPADIDNLTIDAGYISKPALCVSTSTAQDTLSYSIPLLGQSFPATGLSLTIPQFDASLGQLSAVEIQVKTAVYGQYTIENTANTPASVTLNKVGQGIFTGTGFGPGVNTPMNSSEFLGVLSADDGVPNAGPDYKTGAIIPVESTTFVSPSNVAPFIGTGSLTYLVTVNDASNFSGLTGTSAFDANANVEISVRYIFCRPLSTLIGDYVWNDTNKDGIQDSGELGISGVTVTLYDSVNRIVSTTQTDAFGKYKFEGVAAGKYAVGITPPADYVITLQDQGADDAKDSDLDPVSRKTALFTLAIGDTILTIDAGVYLAQPTTASLGDYIWYDEDNNGLQDAGEDGISDVAVKLINATTNDLIATTLTNTEGLYYFNGLTPGNYYINVTLPVGYTYTQYNQGTDDVDSDLNPSTGNSDVLTLAAGDNLLTLDGGLVIANDTTASLGDRVWYDTNTDGLQDAGELGLAGVEVTLLDVNNVPLQTTFTDAFGYYSFTNLAPNRYRIRVGAPFGYVVTAQNTGFDENLDSDIDVTGLSDLIVLNENDRNLTLDAGIYETTPAGTAAIGDFVWLDSNKDGVQDVTEVGFAGIIVTLIDNNTNNELANTTSDANGFYQFLNLAAGDYRVRFSNLPPATQFTAKGGGTTSTDNDADPATGLSGIINLSVGEYDATIDAGIVRNEASNATASLGNYVWEDLNNDGLQGADEPGVGGVRAVLYNIGGTSLATTTTDAAGKYIFNGLQAGLYYVIFENLPLGYNFVTNDQGADDEVDSDADALTGQTLAISLAAGENNMSIDAGIFNPAALGSIGDFVWNDRNGNGIQEPLLDEVGFPGISVTLYNNLGQSIRSTVTDDLGGYLFNGLPAGTYSVGFGNLPAGFQFTQKDQTNDNEDSDVNPSGITSPFALANGQNRTDIDAGIFSTATAAIGNRVWIDSNENGIQDAGERGISGINVILLDNSGSPISSAITNDLGEYYFLNIAPSTYVLRFTDLPVGTVFTRQDAGADDADSDVNPTTGETDPFTVSFGDVNYTFDAGIFAPQRGALTGLVWYDKNKDGIRDANEVLVPGVTVNLIQNGVVVSVAVTGADGVYNFTNLPAGNYTVQFTTLPNGSDFTLANQGADDDRDSDVDDLVNGFVSTPVTVLSSVLNDGPDAGITIPATLGGLTWFDANANGIRDANENPQVNVLVTLYQIIAGNPTQIRTQRTQDDGSYLFTGLRPGNYYVVFGSVSNLSITFANQGGDDTKDSDANQTTGRAPANSADVIPLDNGDNVRNVDAGYATGTFPISLLSFKGQLKNYDAHLQWVTVKERNADYFIVERSIDGQPFGDTNIGTVDAIGNTDEEHTYPVVIDPQVGLLNASKVVYRLKMVDIDGTFEYSKEQVEILLNQGVEPIFANVYPNPTNSELNIQYILNEVKYAEVRVSNALGQTVYHNEISANANMQVLTINVNDWAKGGYIVQIISEEFTKIFKVIVE